MCRAPYDLPCPESPRGSGAQYGVPATIVSGVSPPPPPAGVLRLGGLLCAHRLPSREGEGPEQGGLTQASEASPSL